jgi:tRNA-binding protein
MTLSWETFKQVEMRVGRVTDVWESQDTQRPSYWMDIDFGPKLGVKRSSAAIRDFYHKSDLLGRLVVAVTNFPPKQIGHHLSEVLVLAAVESNQRLSLLGPDSDVALGAHIA